MCLSTAGTQSVLGGGQVVLALWCGGDEQGEGAGAAARQGVSILQSIVFHVLEADRILYDAEVVDCERPCHISGRWRAAASAACRIAASFIG